MVERLGDHRKYTPLWCKLFRELERRNKPDTLVRHAVGRALEKQARETLRLSPAAFAVGVVRKALAA